MKIIRLCTVIHMKTKYINFLNGMQIFSVPPTMNIAAGSPMLYYLHPDVSFFKGNGFTALGPYLDMPDNSSAGNVSCSSDILVNQLFEIIMTGFFSPAGLEPARYRINQWYLLRQL